MHRLLPVLLIAFVGGLSNVVAMGSLEAAKPVRHVLLISIDGLHAVDLINYTQTHPQSTLATMVRAGANYTQARTPAPADSFPGMVALATGGTPVSTGIWYDDTINRNYLAPGSTKDSPGSPGVEVAWDESLDRGFNDGKWGQAGVDPKTFTGAASIDPKALVVDPKTFQPVYPHQYLLVNTIFEVARTAGLRTAWNDKHPSYEILNGPSGQGISDLYTPEISAPVVPGGEAADKSVTDAQANDQLKVQAVINELRGYDHTGATLVGVPAIVGMNFQAVSVGQKVVKGGYSDSQGTPTGDLVAGLDGVDRGLGQLLSTLKDQNLTNNTLVIVTAKHGQAPIDPSTIHWVDDGNLIPVLAAQGIPAWTAANDTTASLWLKDPSQAAMAAKILLQVPPVYPVFDKAAKKNLYAGDKTAGTWGKIERILYGETLPFKDPTGAGRYPDLVIQLSPGTVFGKPWKKIAEHGGFSEDETHVALLVLGPGVKASAVETPVQTAQVAPTILKALGLDPNNLQAVQIEKTAVLPGLF